MQCTTVRYRLLEKVFGRVEEGEIPPQFRWQEWSGIILLPSRKNFHEASRHEFLFAWLAISATAEISLRLAIPARRVRRHSAHLHKQKTPAKAGRFLYLWRFLNDIRTSIIQSQAIHFLRLVDEWVDISALQRELNAGVIRT